MSNARRMARRIATDNGVNLPERCGECGEWDCECEKCPECGDKNCDSDECRAMQMEPRDREGSIANRIVASALVTTKCPKCGNSDRRQTATNYELGQKVLALMDGEWKPAIIWSRVGAAVADKIDEYWVKVGDADPVAKSPSEIKLADDEWLAPR